MKKIRVILIVVLVLLAAAVGSVYIFIPAKITVSHIVMAKIPVNRAADFFIQKEVARNWMTGKETDSCFCKDDVCFCFLDNGSGDVVIRTTSSKLPQQYGYIYFDRLGSDSAAITWTISYTAGNSPFSRVSTYLAARELKKKIVMNLDSLVHFVSDNTRLYGFQPVHEHVNDTLSLSQKKVFDHYPMPAEIKSLTDDLKQYSIKNGATITRPPMMNVVQAGKERFETMVAVPIDRAVPDAGAFVLKRMPPGKIIVATINGGMYTIRKGLQQLEQYKTDKMLTSPAIPYQSMVTDRVNEPDTMKWVTRVYFPVF